MTWRFPRRRAEPALVVVTVGALLAGGVGWLADAREFADVCWVAGTGDPPTPA
jgi:hypothetical protein